jgi:hypothetical protein
VWSKLDDSLIDHRKIFVAGELIGKDGPAIAMGLFTVGLIWTNKQLTDGFLPAAVVKNFAHCDQPLKVAEALVSAGLWEKQNGGYQIHDFLDHNFTAAEYKEHRDRQHETKARAGRLGGLKSGLTRRAKARHRREA